MGVVSRLTAGFKNSLMAGILAILFVGVPFWYFMETWYPQYTNNLLYLGVGFVVLIFVVVFGAKYAARKAR